MDTGKTKDNYIFYEGFEGEPEIILTFSNAEVFHIWDGYFDDIYNRPSLDGKGWNGFTRDYHQMEGIFANGGDTVKINPKEYLDDLMLYKDKNFDFEETAQVFDLMVALFEKAIENGVMLKAEFS